MASRMGIGLLEDLVTYEVMEGHRERKPLASLPDLHFAKCSLAHFHHPQYLVMLGFLSRACTKAVIFASCACPQTSSALETG